MLILNVIHEKCEAREKLEIWIVKFGFSEFFISFERAKNLI